MQEEVERNGLPYGGHMPALFHVELDIQVHGLHVSLMGACFRPWIREAKRSRGFT